MVKHPFFESYQGKTLKRNRSMSPLQKESPFVETNHGLCNLLIFDDMNQEVEPFIQDNVAWAKLPPHVKQVFNFYKQFVLTAACELIRLMSFLVAWWVIQGI